MIPIIDVEFQSLIPPLTQEEYAGLEASILKEGCRDALVLWKETLVDGHNRLAVCQKHGLPYETRTLKFSYLFRRMRTPWENLPKYAQGITNTGRRSEWPKPS